MSTIALTDAWHGLKPKFEAGGHKIDLVLGTGGAIGADDHVASLAFGDPFILPWDWPLHGRIGDRDPSEHYGSWY